METEMEPQKKLAILILNHLKNQLAFSDRFGSDALESLEVSVQCIESAYNIHPSESDHVDKKLEDIVKEYDQCFGSDVKPNCFKSEVSKRNKAEAEYHKNCGNEFMKNQNNENAIEAYSKSVSLDPTNPIYYCNRAAAYNAIGKYKDAIEDCQKAIELDSNYCKAYCRLGLAFSYLKDYHKAVSCYKKACELDPDNIGYRRNYQLTLNNLHSSCGPDAMPHDESAGPPPNLVETAARLMTDPEVSSVLTNILGDVSNSANGGLDRLMQVGQTIVTRLQTSNPNLLDGLRMQFQNAQNEGQPPPQNGFPNEDNHS